MVARFKLNEDDHSFLAAPQGASLLFSGASGTETWIERSEDTTVRLGIQSVAVATADGGCLGVCIEAAGASAKGQDGPGVIEFHLTASQAIHVTVKAGERFAFKAYPIAEGAQVLRTIVWSCDLDGPAAPELAARVQRTRTSASTPEVYN
jgi:hypothetical protein